MEIPLLIFLTKLHNLRMLGCMNYYIYLLIHHIIQHISLHIVLLKIRMNLKNNTMFY